MTSTDPKPRDANETVWIARCPIDCPNFEGAYIFAAPNPPILQRTGKKHLVWNYGFHVLTANNYHRLFKGLRLHPSEGPQKVRLSIKRAHSGPWVARYHLLHSTCPRHYVFGIGLTPKLIGRGINRKRWFPRSLTLTSQTFEYIFNGIRLPPNSAPTHVALTATPTT